MNRLQIFCFLIILAIIVMNCGNPKKNAMDSQDSVDSLKATSILQPKLILPQLEEGDFHVTDDAFGSTINLSGQPFNIKENFEPSQVIVKDKYLIINTWRKDSIFMIFQLPELKYLCALGIRYLGPEGFVSPRLIESSDDSILFYIYENSDDKVYKVTKDHLLPEYYITLPKPKFYLSDKQIAFYGKDKAYYSASTENDRFIYYFNKDSIPQEKVIKELAIPGIKCSWTTVLGDFGINKDYGRLVYAYKYYKRIKIMDIEKLREKNLIFKARELDKGLDDVETGEPTNITHFWGMSPRDNYFWLTYSGRAPVDVIRDNQLKKKYIFVEKYDWNGNPIKRYRLDDWGYLCVDEKNNTIYMASTTSLNTIVRYVVPDN